MLVFLFIVFNQTKFSITKKKYNLSTYQHISSLNFPGMLDYYYEWKSFQKGRETYPSPFFSCGFWQVLDDDSLYKTEHIHSQIHKGWVTISDKLRYSWCSQCEHFISMHSNLAPWQNCFMDHRYLTSEDRILESMGCLYQLNYDLLFLVLVFALTK